jgi:Ras-related protein Rab-7A
MRQFAGQEFGEDDVTVVTVNSCVRDVVVEDGQIVHMQVWDIPGKERFRDTKPAPYYRGANCCVLVFDVTNEASFRSLNEWREGCSADAEDPDGSIPFVVLANKTDQASVVETKRVQTWCTERGNIPLF